MAINNQIATCSEQYSKWKKLALDANTLSDVKDCLGKALFWLEMQTAFVTLWSVEKMHGNNPAAKRSLILAKTNLSKKLAEYAQKTLDEMNWR
jgi:hypothetical protein